MNCLCFGLWVKPGPLAVVKVDIFPALCTPWHDLDNKVNVKIL